jgi:hypothetical protein
VSRTPHWTPQIVSNPAYQHLVRWSDDGDALQILNVDGFSEILPAYFKVRALSEGLRRSICGRS